MHLNDKGVVKRNKIRNIANYFITLRIESVQSIHERNRRLRNNIIIMPCMCRSCSVWWKNGDEYFTGGK
jgi:hypothetical protein